MGRRPFLRPPAHRTTADDYVAHDPLVVRLRREEAIAWKGADDQARSVGVRETWRRKGRERRLALEQREALVRRYWSLAQETDFAAVEAQDEELQARILAVEEAEAVLTRLPANASKGDDRVAENRIASAERAREETRQKLRYLWLEAHRYNDAIVLAYGEGKRQTNPLPATVLEQASDPTTDPRLLRQWVKHEEDEVRAAVLRNPNLSVDEELVDDILGWDDLRAFVTRPSWALEVLAMPQLVEWVDLQALKYRTNLLASIPFEALRGKLPEVVAWLRQHGLDTPVFRLFEQMLTENMGETSWTFRRAFIDRAYDEGLGDTDMVSSIGAHSISQEMAYVISFLYEAPDPDAYMSWMGERFGFQGTVYRPLYER